MISTEICEGRTFTDEMVRYEKASPQELFEQAGSAKGRDMRAYAAAGLVRAVLDVAPEDRDDREYPQALAWTTDILMEVRRNGDTTKLGDMNNYVAGLPKVNAMLDAFSVAATRANKPGAMAAVLQQRVANPGAVLLLALGHGGIIAGADTYQALQGENHAFHPIRFSMAKHKDMFPRLSTHEMDLLRRVARDHSVVVFDEDRTEEATTITTAVKYFAKQLGAIVAGATIAHARQPNHFKPYFIEADGRL